MRKLGIAVTAIACLMLAAVTFAADNPAGAGAAKGQLEIGVMGGLAVPTGKLSSDVTRDSETGAGMKLGYGGGLFIDYFVMPELAIGLDGSHATMTNKDDSSVKANTLEFGLHAKYVIPIGGKVVPYLQVGGAMYKQTLKGDIISIDDSKFGFNAGVGAAYKVTEKVNVGLNGFYNMAGKFEPEISGTKEEVLKDWSYITFNVVVSYAIPMGK